MPNGPRPLKKQQGQSKESDEGQVRIKREGEQFTEEDEAVLKKVAKQLLKDPNDMETYDRLSEKVSSTSSPIPQNIDISKCAV